MDIFQKKKLNFEIQKSKLGNLKSGDVLVYIANDYDTDQLAQESDINKSGMRLNFYPV